MSPQVAGEGNPRTRVRAGRGRAAVLHVILLAAFVAVPGAVCAAGTADLPPVARPGAAADVPARSEQVLRVGRGREFATIAQAAGVARDGDTIEIDGGDYVKDVAAWPQNRIVLRGVNGTPRLIADGASSEGKAIWVIKGTDVLVENVVFIGAKVPGRNGAGIRHEGGKLTVRRCRFERNEIGLLTWNAPTSELEVEGSAFRDNVVTQEPLDIDPGHQIYVGAIARFSLRASYVSHGANGHLVKSRARENRIFYNRITDETGFASYELEFPSGGLAWVVGNLIEQGPRTRNEVMISFGAEGYRWPRNELYLAHNTLVDRYAAGQFLRVAPGAQRVLAVNNLLFGRGTFDPEGGGNVRATAQVFAAPDAFDFRVVAGTLPVGRAVEAGIAHGVPLAPDREYVHPLDTRPLREPPVTPGALQSLAPADKARPAGAR